MPGFDAMRKLPMLYDHPVPVLPAILILLGIIIFVIEYPLVGKAYLTSSDSYMPRVAFYIPLAVLSLLEGQTVNGGVYLAIGAVAYMMAIRAEFRKQQTKTGSRMP
ncbi:hypothetical protein BGW38_001759 [Lunasporangiospora selenospora]|uniref:DUF7727 domain-containing protein n=1 Tax=Lunasporangiospora selenospora TaxID=979761 RepID=A0A9P6FTN4_9FUNG|nr:hypothetical protein BGW38_001759 [Lunasporangiospora selenospora]